MPSPKNIKKNNKEIKIEKNKNNEIKIKTIIPNNEEEIELIEEEELNILKRQNNNDKRFLNINDKNI